MHLPTWLLIFVTVVVTTQVANLLTTIYLHRGLAHRAVTFHPSVEWAMRVIIWLTTIIERREWVAVHRKHHHFTDQEGDPHSPLIEGFWKIQLLNLHYYRKEARNAETLARYAKDIQEDGFDRFHAYVWVPVLLLAVIFVLILGPIWGPVALLLHYGVYIFLSATINGAGHRIGYRRHKNTATNLWISAILTSGEGFHNNHHHDAQCPRLGEKWWEVDLGWWGIKALKRLGLARLATT